jgi:hypothetical protein
VPSTKQKAAILPKHSAIPAKVVPRVHRVEIAPNWMSLATAAVRGFLVFIEIAIEIGIQIVPFTADEGSAI